jgi:GNAT superfamily N-acetyltransferase
MAFLGRFSALAKKDGAWLTQGKVPIHWTRVMEGSTYAGSIGLLPVGVSRCRVRGWFVRGRFRGRGYGVKLLAYAVKQAEEKGFSIIECRTKHYGLCLAKMPGVWVDTGVKYSDGGHQLIHKFTR